MRPRFCKLNKSNYADLHEQKDKAKQGLEAIQQQVQGDPSNIELHQKEKDARSHYINILSSVMDLLKQQSKIEWIKYGDDCTKLLFAKAKQRKLATYVYTITVDDGGRFQSSWESNAKLLQKPPRETIYTKKPQRPRGLRINAHKSQILFGGCPEELQEKCIETAGLQVGTFPLKYLGVPITASRLSKTKCRPLIEKIMARVQLWATRRIFFAGRAHWALIFILQAEVLDTITQISRNFLWSEAADYKCTPHISWKTICLPKKSGALGVKDLTAWNKAKIAKLIWVIAEKKDICGWWDYKPPQDCSWYWRKICYVKEVFKKECTNQNTWEWRGQEAYTLKEGYKWLLGDAPRVSWTRAVWTRTHIPRHAFISWILMHHRLPTKKRISKFKESHDTACDMCNASEEDDDHIIFQCRYAKEVWAHINKWWPGAKNNIDDIPKIGDPAEKRNITYAVTTTTVYLFWLARNQQVFQGQIMPAETAAQMIKEQISQRILFLNMQTGKYSIYIDKLLA
ncbi:LOW QUALITY PROTEIN: hypothetical protein Cgig2_028752 [Carnegiea gigantea]|uniref:Reverse transcriptase zinc-binding domain-containing protein n=1 Tax=Carnegiea gigantea TaxID=171969 RepID=A0A9Q1GW72_9CARY|nr:LOW QUALITY PROTEIN: hypothetical protein Cgig2_028752 [Carnegiea gigantea]